MTEKKAPSGAIGKTFKLFLLIFVVLLVPLSMDQAEVGRETVRLAGRIAAGITILLIGYGIFAKLMKVVGFIIMLAFVAVVVLVSEGEVKAPRLAQLWSAREEGR